MECLGIIGEELRNLGLNAEFDEWTGKIPDTYWVYTYIEADNVHETNCKEGTIIINGFSRIGISELEQEKEKIIQKFMDFRETINNTTVFLGSATGEQIETQNTEIKRIQINIDFKEWRY